jgi:hypothetical protein
MGGDRPDDGDRSESSGSPPHLNHEQLVRARQETLATPRRRYGPPARVLFRLLDTDYGSFASIADLFRQIGHDERVHKQESIERMTEPRFG